MTSNKNKHFTLDERRIILNGIINGATKSSIAQTLGKEKSTVGKEIKKHRTLSYKSSLPSQCSNYKRCTQNRTCLADCPDYKQHYVNAVIALLVLVMVVLPIEAAASINTIILLRKLIKNIEKL